MLTLLACLALGLFIGGYALSSFAPVSVAPTIYQRNWGLWALFMALAYLQSMNDNPRQLGASEGADTGTLITVVVLGMGVAFIAGMRWARREDARLAGQAEAEPQG